MITRADVTRDQIIALGHEAINAGDQILAAACVTAVVGYDWQSGEERPCLMLGVDGSGEECATCAAISAAMDLIIAALNHALAREEKPRATHH